MSMLWQKNLQLPLDNAIIDVIQFGSSTIDGVTPNDIDIAVLFKDVPLKKQLEVAQDIKQEHEKTNPLPVHVKAYTYETLFSENNFARPGILGHGISILTKKPFAETLGLTAHIEFAYSLQQLTKTQKVRIHYQLRGKKGAYGILKKIEGDLVRPGLIRVPVSTEKIVEDFFTEEHIEYKKKLVFEIQ